MAEYIDRVAVSERLHRLIVNFYSAYEKDGKDERLAALLELDLAARSVINAIPAADVAEVRHGRWIWHDDDNEYECSVCHIRFDYDKTYALFDNGYPLVTYCPNCGARMDERSEDNV